MRKIFLLYVITKLELGGAQKQLLSLISHLDKERFKIFLFTAGKGLLLEEFLSLDGIILKQSRYLERPINSVNDFLALIEIYRFIKKNNIDIVHTHSSKAGILGRIAARLANVRFIVHTVHGWSFNDYQPFFVRWIFIWLERVAANFTHKLIVVSYFDKQKGLKNQIGVQEKYVLIRYGINYKEFVPRPAPQSSEGGIPSHGQRLENKDVMAAVQPLDSVYRNPNANSGLKDEFGLEPGDLFVVNISCFKPQKSPQDFIKLAFLINKIIPNVKFLLVGDGILRARIENLIRKFNLRNKVILSGWRRDIPEILSITDVFVLTSLWEGLPISVLEALAARCPIVATNTGGIREAVREGQTGFLVPCRNMKEMSERVVVLLRDEKFRERIVNNSNEVLNLDFSLENMVKNTRDLYLGMA